MRAVARMGRRSASRKSRVKAVLLSLIVTTTAFFFIIAPEPVLASGVGPDCTPCPGGIWCFPSCIHFASITVTNATNTTIFFELVSSDAYVSLVWGNTTNYGFWAIKNVHYLNGQWFEVFLDYLQPSTTYYYKFTGNATSQIMGTYTGQWTTSSEGTYVSEYGTVIRGVVYNANGAPAPAGVEVEVQCTGSKPYATFGVTNTNGAYSIDPIIGASTCTTDNDGYFIAEVQNYVNTPWPGEVTTLWPGWWNESVVIWAAQFVNFYLPANFVSPYIPQAVDFSNANSTNGWTGITSITYTQTTSYTTAASYCWHLFIWGGCSSSSQPVFDATHSYTSQAGNLVVSQRFWTSGTVEFVAMDRGAAITSTDYYADYGSPQFPAQQLVSDWLTPTNTSPGHYYINTWGTGGYGVKVTYQYPQGGSVTTITTSSTTGTITWDLTVDISIDGVGVGIPVAGQAWSQTSTSMYEKTLSWNVSVPESIDTICAVVYGEGGSQTQNTADNIGVWLYDSGFTGTDCPLP